MTLAQIQLERGLSFHAQDQHERHMRNASAYLLQAIVLALRGIDPKTPDEPYRLPKSGGGW